LLVLGGLLAFAALRDREGLVTGFVHFDGRPLDAGTLTFLTGSGTRSTAVARDGSYQVRLPPGVVRVAFFHHPAVPLGLQDPLDPEPPSPPVPDRYEDPATSGLSCTVHGGKQLYSVELTP
jgi:hypothetical protein